MYSTVKTLLLCLYALLFWAILIASPVLIPVVVISFAVLRAITRVGRALVCVFMPWRRYSGSKPPIVMD